ncbi:Glutathione-regulated potassium-efflux system protein KefC [Kutzneria sp. CA-103260]|nr:Glutathione-regulated potassium-efflux system protein KefC [Kutzneria sp. CA-103260]
MRLGEEVVVILPSAQRGRGKRIAAMPGVRVVESEEVSDEAFEAAGLAGARALALVDQDDLGNIHAALRAGETRPDIRLVIRMFNTGLGNEIRTLFADCAMLSDSRMAAPWFVAAALGELAPSHVRLPGRTLYVARRDEVAPAAVICGIADTEHGGQARLLPPEEGAADLVLAVADPAATDPLQRHRRWRNPVTRLLDWIRTINRPLVIAFVVTACLLVVSTILFATVGGNNLSDALYLTVLDAAGAAQPDITLAGPNKIIQVLDTLLGIVLIPVITAAVVGGVVTAQLSDRLGTRRAPIRDHMVVVGLGNIGSRVVGQLRDLGMPVVCVERDATAPGVALARRLGASVILGDAAREDTLRSASVGTAQALLAVTSDDVTNLQVALHSRRLRSELRTVLRLFDGDLAERVQRTFGIGGSRSVSSLVAPVFAATMLERQVIDTIVVGRRVLLIAEIPLAAGAELIGQRLGEVNEFGEARVLALRGPDTSLLDWQPDLDHVLVEGDRVLVVTTRTGMGNVFSSSSMPAVSG